MRRLVYSMAVSLDGFVEGPGRELDWSTPDEELHRFWNEQARATSTALYGRRLYGLMAGYWPTADADPAAPPVIAEFAALWREMPKVVFSSTLEAVGWNSRLVRGDAVAEVERLKSEPGGDMDVGGPTLAAALIERGLVDEFGLVVHPVVLGAGTPFFPSLGRRLSLRPVDSTRFDSGVVYLRYAAA
ncbi:MAG TPA: dihydrofolate reductase family protein [Gaiellales bacterium]|jgi:dihydrofolate reductase|nr:dihydrofolate reductase family protein [Gaiellales bacterium]